MKAVVLAGGRGTRLAPYTQILPKPLMPIGDMPILEVLIRQMKGVGIEEVILTVGHLEHLLRSYFEDGSRYGVRICYSQESKPLGTAGPLSLISDLEETFLVLNGDILTTLDFSDLVAYHQANGAPATIAMHEREVRIDLGVIHLDGGNEIIDYTEKPCMKYRASMGIYVFEPEVLEFIPNGEYLDFPDLVLEMLAAGKRVIGYPFGGYWKDLGRHEDYQEAWDEFARMSGSRLSNWISTTGSWQRFNACWTAAGSRWAR
jgi:NDP-sugar pyrophosphorylase family protein